MVRLTKEDKEKIQRVQEVEAQLRASANAASQVVGLWLIDSDNDEDTNEETKNQSQTSVKARDVFQGRPARLGIGAKFLSHKDMVRGNRGGDQVVGGPGVLTAEELQLKRRLTRGVGARDNADDAKKHAVREESDDDSRSRAFATQNKYTPTAVDLAQSKPQRDPKKDSSHSVVVSQSPPKKKQKRSAQLLDSLIQRRKR